MFHKLLILLLCFFFSLGQITAQKNIPEVDISELTKAENISEPVVPAKQRPLVTDYMKKEAQALLKLGYQVETERKGEVIVVTIPVDKLFEPNETALIKSSISKIEPFLSYLKAENRFKLLVAMHCDDTGSQSYKENLTNERLQAVMDYITSNAVNPDQVVGYAVADDEPLRPNSSRKNREINRRLEIYIVPDVALIKQLRKK